MKHCKTCKYFNTEYGWSGEDNGNCMRLGANQRLIFDARNNQYITFHKDSNPQNVHVGENFGCVHHEVYDEYLDGEE
jgi:hypothetical protein